MENKVNIIEGKTYLNGVEPDKYKSLLVAIIGELAKANFRETNTFLEALWGIVLTNPVRIVRGDTHGTRVYINTPNKKRLAQAVFEEIMYYLGEPKNKPVNTNVEALIIAHGNEWVQNQPDADILNPQDYAAFVFWATDEALAKMNLDEAEHNAVFDALQSWYEKQCQSPTAQPSEQATPPAVQPDADSNTTPQPTTEPSGIDKEALKALFMPVFFADDFKQRETLNGTTNLSRFDIFVEQLENLLSDAQCDKKRIGNVAYMVHKSRFAKSQYKRSGKFAQTCRLLFECCQREAPKDTHPNKYEQPDSNILQRFSDALGNPLNPQK